MSVSAVELSCASCGAKLVVEPSRRTARCPYCDTPSVVDRPASADRPDPVFGIGFAVDRRSAAARLRTFLHGRRWAPGALRQATSHQLEGVYVPAYLYTATAASRYRAEIGEDYTVTEVDARKKGVKRVRKTEYRTLEGSHLCYVDGLVVTASGGLGNDELEAIEPYDPAGLRRFTPALVSGWVAEEPSLARKASLELARAEARAQVLRRLHAFMPGDSHRGLQAATDLGDEAMDLVLAPVWVCAVRWREDRPPVRLLVNGQTGRVAGAVPVSWAKVAAVVGAGLALVALAVLIGALL
ncbi:MAG TPA: hypothetical protein VLB51_11590 [Methylomirabilota bacterium]|nr:hypothetical protein [Methylomirabilota bacterium]